MSTMINLRKSEQFENFTLYDPFKHHNNYFVKEVKSTTKTIQDLGNSFAHRSQDCVYWIQNTLISYLTEETLFHDFIFNFK